MEKIKIKDGIIEGLVNIDEIKQSLSRERELKLAEYSVSDDIISVINNKSLAMRTLSEQQKI